MRLEELTGRLVIQLAGHNEPRNAVTVLLGDPAQTLRKILKERLVQNRRDRIGSLRAVETEPSPLSARDGQRGHLSIPDQLHALLKRPFVQCLLLRILRDQREIRCRRKIIGNRGHRLVHHIIPDQDGESIPVDLLDLLFEFLISGPGEFVQRVQNLSLTILFQHLGDVLHLSLLEYVSIFPVKKITVFRYCRILRCRGRFRKAVPRTPDGHPQVWRSPSGRSGRPGGSRRDGR